MKEHTGGCLCGAVRYVFTGEPRSVSLCHCSHCQKLSGGSFTINLVVREQDFAQQGITSIFEDTGDSGNQVQRHFCGDCGSHILAKIASAPGKIVLKGGTLDHPNSFTPQAEIYTGRASPWLLPVENTQRFPQGI
ncbi:GFA family protein [Stutzerimonas nitrititolerans]|uniref:GFA family protein n=1 Tax=Stutzerimonas nitrititolerans TaxID=2482751 RepID=UPI0028AB7D7E|nr:GFA family protein [Stutzerimonas nitrititolerans]